MDGIGIINRKNFIIISLLILLGGLLFGLSSKTPMLEDSEVTAELRIPDLMKVTGFNYLEVSPVAPDFDLESLDGTMVDLQGLKGNTVLLGFWATW